MALVDGKFDGKKKILFGREGIAVLPKTAFSLVIIMCSWREAGEHCLGRENGKVYH